MRRPTLGCSATSVAMWLHRHGSTERAQRTASGEVPAGIPGQRPHPRWHRHRHQAGRLPLAPHWRCVIRHTPTSFATFHPTHVPLARRQQEECNLPLPIRQLTVWQSRDAGQMAAACRGSLRRLQLERAAIGQVHWSAAKYAPLQERALWDGLVRMYGEVVALLALCSNQRSPRIQQAAVLDQVYDGLARTCPRGYQRCMCRGLLRPLACPTMDRSRCRRFTGAACVSTPH